MRRWTWITSTLLIATAFTARAQEPRQDRDEPQGRGMMMRLMIGRGMMGPGMPMQGMMPMMMEMHGRQAASESQWEATDDGIFVLRPDQLRKYDTDLNLTKSVDLPKLSSPSTEDEKAEKRPGMASRMAHMQQMMAGMHGALPSKLDVTSDAVYVSRGNRLLKYSRDLELQKSVDLPEVKPMMCPMCEQMMRDNSGDENE